MTIQGEWRRDGYYGRFGKGQVGGLDTLWADRWKIPLSLTRKSASTNDPDLVSGILPWTRNLCCRASSRGEEPNNNEFGRIRVFDSTGKHLGAQRPDVWIDKMETLR